MHAFFALLKKIIRTGIGKGRFIMASLGLGIAMVLILIALQANSDFNQLLYSDKNQNETADFLVINKKVTNSMMGQPQKMVLSQEEIDNIRRQPFVQASGLITSSKFKVVAQAPGELHFATDMFFESVPDSFIDVKEDDWKWEPGNRVIPIILPNDFLNLYNFGFSLSQDLPQISQETVKALPLQIVISNGLISETYTGHIVGFSDRISSFLVPASFMDWANEKYGVAGTATTASRIVIKTADPSNPALVKFLNDNGYTTNQDKLKFSKTRVIVQTIVSVIGFFGLVLLFFALLVFSMFIQLIIASCKKEIQLLVTLGTAPKQLQRYLLKQFIPLYIVIGVVSLLIVVVLQYQAHVVLAKHDMAVSPLPAAWTFAGAAVVISLVYIVNLVTVRKYILQDQ